MTAWSELCQKIPLCHIPKSRCYQIKVESEDMIFVHNSIFMSIEYKVTVPEMPHVSSMTPNLPFSTRVFDVTLITKQDTSPFLPT